MILELLTSKFKNAFQYLSVQYACPPVFPYKMQTHTHPVMICPAKPGMNRLKHRPEQTNLGEVCPHTPELFLGHADGFLLTPVMRRSSDTLAILHQTSPLRKGDRREEAQNTTEQVKTLPNKSKHYRTHQSSSSDIKSKSESSTSGGASCFGAFLWTGFKIGSSSRGWPIVAGRDFCTRFGALGLSDGEGWSKGGGSLLPFGGGVQAGEGGGSLLPFRGGVTTGEALASAATLGGISYWSPTAMNILCHHGSCLTAFQHCFNSLVTEAGWACIL